MGDENEFMKLPTDEKCVHKLWKARVAGYEEAIKLFNQIDDEKSPEWSKYFGLIKKFVTDSNAVAQEKGLEAALVFVENCGHAGKTTGEVMSGIVTKCIAAPRTKTKDLALQVTLMYVEIEKPDIVQEELMKGMEHKNPRIVAACISATTTALRQFGNKVFSIKPLVKKIPITLADRDKDVRAEGKALVVEMHRWVGPAIEPHIASLQAVVQQELRDAFSAAGSAQPTRWLKSQQARQAELATQVDDECDGGAEEDDSVVGAGDSPDMDPYDLMDPVDILSKLPKDFYDKLEAKKWQERKEALDSLENVLKNAIRLETGDYADLVRALKKVISKDSNVMLVALSGRLLGSVASGLRNKFQPYAVSCVSAILEKFKERKVNVVTSLREAIDAIYPCTNLEAILEEVLEALNNKNPSVKAETSLFLARAFCRTQPAAFNKKMLKAYVGGLLKLIESAEPIVRDASAEALGTAMKLVTEKNIAPHIGKLDNLKEQKIKEFCDKAVITVKVAGPKKETRPKSAPAAKEGALKAGSTQPKPVKRPTTGVKKGTPGKKAPAGASKQGTASKASAPALLREQELSQEEVDERADELFSTEVMAGLADTNWKTRLSSIQTFTSTVQGLSPGDASAQVLLRALNKKPGLKDTNFQVLKCRLEVVKLIAQSFTISATSVDFIIQDVVEKLGDAKCSSVAADALTALAEATKLEHVGLGALEYAMDKQKNPKVQAEVYNWLANAIREFGFSISIKSVIAHSKKGVGAINPAVRTSCIAFLGVVSLYVGPSIIQHFDGEKPALKQQIMQEFDKYANDKAPSPIRGLSKSASKASMGEDLDEESANDYGDDEPAPAVVQDTTTRTDISLLITDSLISEINDKNWKVRNEGLDKLRAIIATSSPIKSTLGELPPALASRLLDSNSKIAQMALQIAESLATAMGPKCKTHVRAFFPGFFLSLGDSKQWIRSAALQCLGTWCVQAGGAQVALDGEMVHDTLKAGSPALKAELLQWLAESLPDVPNKSFPKEELSVCLPVLYAAVEDRNADVRKNAGEAVLGFMLHLGYEAMHKQLEKLKPASKPVVLAALDKARPNLPVQPLPTAKPKPDGKAVKSGGAQKKEAEKKGAGGNVQKVKGIVKPSSATGKSKKEEEEALMPLMPNNNAKNQRIIDDQKLKVLKWNFTQPREEFFDLLKDQMTSAGLNKQLIANMFHADFRYHLKALESLLEDLSENGSALMANLDLVLKWLTLRFFDTNPSVILKGLEYLSAVFNYLISEEYTMAEYEANCFIPYLVLKVGDPKDSVRNGVKALFKQICIVYSVTKLFGYLMEGLKSKNARQRSECMECICHLMECYGSSVCAPSPAVALRELARHIGDRDNAVRSAALNCVTQAYFLEGEKIYKMIGQISDKDQSLLEERIKRAAKTRSAENRKSTLLPLTSTGKQLLRQHSDPCLEESDLRVPENQISVDAVPGVYEDRSPEPEPAIPVVVRPQPAALLNGPFGLDPELIAKLDAMKPLYAKHETPEIDLQFLDETVTVATVRPSIAVAGMKNNMLPMSPPSIISSAGRPPASFLGPPSLQPEDNLLTHFIHSIASPNLNVATTAMSHIKEVAMSGRGAALRPHDEQLLRAAATQVRQLRLTPPSPDVHAAFKYIMAMLTALYESKEACGGSGEAGSAVLAQLVSELLRVLAARTLETATDAPRLVRALNYVCVRVLDGSDHTNLLCALMTLLHESIGGDMRYQELLMKCLWKVLKMIPNWEPGSMDYDALMYRIHLFYMAYPNSYWKKNTEMNDTPCRTVKTLVHSLVKIKGSAIMNHLSQIPDATETELYAYLLKLFKQLKLEERKENVEVNGGGSKMSRAVHDELGHILKRISEKGTSRDALVQLYELRERHPAIDIWTYMRGSSLHFRSYIERGLRDVAEERRGGAPLHHVAAGVYSSLAMSAANVAAHAEGKDDPNEPEGGEKHYTYFLERLRALQTQAGLRNDAAPGSQPRTPVIDNKAMVDSFSGDPVRTHNIDPQFDLHPSQPLSQRNEAGVDALRQKLQQIKSSSKR